jgi:hypothetical protein
MSDSSTVYLFPHVPKCAGNSVLTFFKEHLPAEAFVAIYSKTDQKTWEHSRINLPQAQRDKVRVLYGHRLPQKAEEGFSGRTIREIGLLREPVSFKVSMYNFFQKNPVIYGVAGLSFEKWYARSKHNSVSRFYLKAYFGLNSASMRLMSQRRRFEFLSERFERFWFVGDYRNCDEVIGTVAADLDIASEKLGNANTAPKDGISIKDLGPSMRQRILDDNSLDRALYDAWAKRLWQGKPMLEAGNDLSKRWTWQ